MRFFLTNTPSFLRKQESSKSVIFTKFLLAQE